MIRRTSGAVVPRPNRPRSLNLIQPRALEPGIVVTMRSFERERRRAHSEVVGSRRRGVANPGAGGGVDSLPGIDLDGAFGVLDDERSTEHDRVLVESGVWLGSAQPARLRIRATLTWSLPVLPMPTYSSIIFGVMPAARTRRGSSMRRGAVLMRVLRFSEEGRGA